MYESCSKDFKSRDTGAFIRCIRDLLKVTGSSLKQNLTCMEVI